MNESFFELTPHRVLSALEEHGIATTGLCTALNSFENRVYEVELEGVPFGADEERAKEWDDLPRNSPLRRRIIKFYRPGRWTDRQIQEEHQFLMDLVDAEVPVIAPQKFQDGSTLKCTAEGIYFSVFPKLGGRSPEELNTSDLLQVGRLLARIHQVGLKNKSTQRIEINPITYGENHLDLLLKNWVPLDFRKRYELAAAAILEQSKTLWREILGEGNSLQIQRLHGDCHLGNLLRTRSPAQGAGSEEQSSFYFVDFDDMVRGPVVQDLWLLIPGRDAEAKEKLELLLEGYSEMGVFPREQLRLIEPLRALRYIHYSAWLAQRWEDPAFPLAFPHFNSHQYWRDETTDLEQQLQWIQNLSS